MDHAVSAGPARKGLACHEIVANVIAGNISENPYSQ